MIYFQVDKEQTASLFIKSRIQVEISREPAYALTFHCVCVFHRHKMVYIKNIYNMLHAEFCPRMFQVRTLYLK
jgi:hypothetical protein